MLVCIQCRRAKGGPFGRLLEVELARIPFDRPAGVIAACILPFGEDMEIDAAEYRRHVRAVSSVPGLSGMAQTELDLATLAENERVLDLMLEEVGTGSRSPTASIPGSIATCSASCAASRPRARRP